MKYNDFEKELSNLTIKEPVPNLRDKALLKAKTAWIEKYRIPIFTSRLIRNYAYGLTMLFLISIVSSKIDNFLTNKLIDGNTTSAFKTIEKSNYMGNLCSDLGIDCTTYKLFANMTKPEEAETKPKVFEQLEQLKKEFNLITGGLS